MEAPIIKEFLENWNNNLNTDHEYLLNNSIELKN